MNGRRGQMLRAAVFICGILLATPAPAEEPNVVLTLFWQPGLCFTARGAEPHDCHPTEPGRLALHGLWPNADRNGDGRQDVDDDYCLPPDERATTINHDRSDWRLLPPVPLPDDLRQSLGHAMGGKSHLDRHEWFKHGTCSGLEPRRYFAAAVALMTAVSETEFGQLIASRSDQVVARRDLLQAFATEFGKGAERAVQLLCRKDDGVATLTEVRIRLKASAIEAPLVRGSFDTSHVAKGSCPAQFRVERD